MAIFGAPVAHEDDPERAVRAGLGMQAAMDEVNEPLAAQHGVDVRAACGHQHRRGARRSRRRRLHGDRRHRQRRRAAAGGGASGERHGRRGDLPRDPRGDRLQRAGGAAGAEGQGRAGPRLGGARPRTAAGGGRRGARPGASAAGRAAPTSSPSCTMLLERVAAQARAAPGHGDRRGRRRQVAAAARVRAASCSGASTAAAGAPRALPAVRLEHRLLAARRGDPRRVRDRRRRSARGGVGEALGAARASCSPAPRRRAAPRRRRRP